MLDVDFLAYLVSTQKKTEGIKKQIQDPITQLLLVIIIHSYFSKKKGCYMVFSNLKFVYL